MRQERASRRQREQFLSSSLQKALPVAWAEQSLATVTEGATPAGASMATVQLETPDYGVFVADNLTMSDGFSVLWEDRDANGEASEVKGVDVEWRDRMLAARKLCTTVDLSREDCDKVLQCGIYGEVRHPPA